MSASGVSASVIESRGWPRNGTDDGGNEVALSVERASVARPRASSRCSTRMRSAAMASASSIALRLFSARSPR